MQTIGQFVESNNIKIRAERVGGNRNAPDWKDADHWKVVLTCGGRKMTTYFSKGYGHKGAAPTAEEVLDCLASDSASVENARSFEDWAGDMGYDTDSRKAERVYKVCIEQAAKLCIFLGDGAYKMLLWATERE